MFKKLMLLAASVAALVAIAAPAAAQAETPWFMNGGGGVVGEKVTLSGPAAFEVPGVAGAHATVHATLQLGANGSGTVTAFHVTGCTGTGQLNNLPCTATPTFPNWPATALKNGKIEINIPAANPLHNLYYTNPQHTGTPVATTVLSGQVIADPDARGAISAVTLTTGVDVTANGNPAIVTGELEVIENPGTFGF